MTVICDCLCIIYIYVYIHIRLPDSEGWNDIGFKFATEARLRKVQWRDLCLKRDGLPKCSSGLPKNWLVILTHPKNIEYVYIYIILNVYTLILFRLHSRERLEQAKQDWNSERSWKPPENLLVQMQSSTLLAPRACISLPLHRLLRSSDHRRPNYNLM